MQRVRLGQRKINVPLSQVLDVWDGSAGDLDRAADAVSDMVFVDELADSPADGVVEAANPTGRDRHRRLLPRRADILHRADLTAKSDHGDEARHQRFTGQATDQSYAAAARTCRRREHLEIAFVDIAPLCLHLTRSIIAQFLSQRRSLAGTRFSRRWFDGSENCAAPGLDLPEPSPQPLYDRRVLNTDGGFGATIREHTNANRP